MIQAIPAIAQQLPIGGTYLSPVVSRELRMVDSITEVWCDIHWGYTRITQCNWLVKQVVKPDARKVDVYA